MFDDKYSIIENPFITRNNYQYFLLNITQKNIIELNEDGTNSKFMTISRAIANSASEDKRGIEIKLNQPFIYIIRNINKLPVFIGYIKEINN